MLAILETGCFANIYFLSNLGCEMTCYNDPDSKEPRTIPKILLTAVEDNVDAHALYQA